MQKNLHAVHILFNSSVYNGGRNLLHGGICMKEKKSRSGRKIFLGFLVICLGGVTLGAGLTFGDMLAQHFAPEPEVVYVEENPAPTVTTMRVAPATIQINPQDPGFADVIPQVKDSVVSVNVVQFVYRPGGRGELPGAGSGFIFAEDDDYVFIATNNHVVDGADLITISLNDNDNVPAIVVGAHGSSDLAVLAVSKEHLEEKGVPFTIAQFGDSDVMRMGDPVAAIGNAMGEGQTVTQGIVGALNLNITVADPNGGRRLNLDVLQFDAAVNRGNSAGPLLNQYGEVIGVVTAKLLGADIEGMGYAIPANYVMPIIMELKDLGAVRQPFIGISHQEVSERFSQMFNLPSPGIVVREVVPDSPAEAAGILPDDLIVEFAGRRIASRADFLAALNTVRPGDEIAIGIYREGERIEVLLVLDGIIAP